MHTNTHTQEQTNQKEEDVTFFPKEQKRICFTCVWEDR